MTDRVRVNALVAVLSELVDATEAYQHAIDRDAKGLEAYRSAPETLRLSAAMIRARRTLGRGGDPEPDLGVVDVAAGQRVVLTRDVKVYWPLREGTTLDANGFKVEWVQRPREPTG
jgi:hypothetical protein